MVENEWNGREFTSFEYKEIQVPEDKASFYLDCYENLDGQWMISFHRREQVKRY